MPYIREALGSISNPVQTWGGVTNPQAQQLAGRVERSEVQSQLQLCSNESEATQGCTRPSFKTRQKPSSDKASSPCQGEGRRHMRQLVALKGLTCPPLPVWNSPKCSSSKVWTAISRRSQGACSSKSKPNIPRYKRSLGRTKVVRSPGPPRTDPGLLTSTSVR